MGRTKMEAPPRSLLPERPAHKTYDHDTRSTYRRYHIETRRVPDLAGIPPRFRVIVRRSRLALLLLKEFIQYRGNLRIVLNRPCVYGVFSGPVGGFMPRENLCVGCLRCTVQYPDVVRIVRNPARQRLGDSYFRSAFVDAVLYEAQTGLVPVRGAGYRGPFGGDGWDGLWTDMSEIVRPTRDGIHGREFISTSVDMGSKPARLRFRGNVLTGPVPRTVTLQVPFLLDVLPNSVASAGALISALARTAHDTESLFFLPVAQAVNYQNPAVAPIVVPGEEPLLNSLRELPRVIEVSPISADAVTTDPEARSEIAMNRATETVASLERKYPDSVIILRLPFLPGDTLLSAYNRGVRSFHLVANYHGRGAGGVFVMDLIRNAHSAFVTYGVRDEVTLIGSGGIIAAEHVPKAIICGLDAVALDTAPLAALQVQFNGDCVDPRSATFVMPEGFSEDWATQRLKNLFASWRDQLLEILGAMGMREVRRLRGETGRAMFQADLEREVFGDIEGYDLGKR
ncbi:MAG: glutamate synthase-related protein [bacterium JZ-2024 1]